MEFLNKIWKWRVAIIVFALGGWIYYESNESDKRKVVEERKIAEQAENKKTRENLLFDEYNKNKKRLNCNISFKVTLETYGANVNVELRVGEIGNSFPIVVKQASGGELDYLGLCPGRYFIAIGDDKNVSTTPVEDFVSGKKYTSRVHLTKGVGNMGNARRETL